MSEIDNSINKIICGDSLKVLKTLPDESVDIVLTSPPYNLNINYDTYNDNVNWDNYFEWLFLIFDECIRVLKYGGRLIINVAPSIPDNLPTHHIISAKMIERGMIWKGEILWEKNNYNCGYCTWGSWKSPSMPHLKYTWEFVEVFLQRQFKTYWRKGRY